MHGIGKAIKVLIQFLLGLSLVLLITRCAVINRQLQVVDPLPMPNLPDWIEQISPMGNSETLAQIRIRFKEALIPVESIDSSDQQYLLKKFEVFPPLAGQFRFLTPRMVGFQPEQALPKATRLKVTLKAGLTDLAKHRLDRDLAWTFNTEPIKITDLPDNNREPIDLKPTLQFTSNVELDLPSLQKHLQFLPAGQANSQTATPQSIALNIALAEDDKTSQSEELSAQQKFDPSLRNWKYTVIPKQTLEKAKAYRLEFTAGLHSKQGNLPLETALAAEVKTYAPLAFQTLKFSGQPDASGVYGRFVKGSAQLTFNNGLVAESAIANITINPPPKSEPKLIQTYDGETSINLNPYALEPATKYTITLGTGLKDQFGQTLTQPVTIPYETGDVAAELWAPADLHIFPSGQNLQLNVSAVNLPDKQYKAGFAIVQPTDLVYTDTAYPDSSRLNLLPDLKAWESFPVVGEKNKSIESTVALRDRLGGATGMLAYGVQARTNSYTEEKQQKWREPNFYGLVQLTNLGVFAQWFPDSGFVRVHHLDDGTAVANAAVEVYESQLEATSRPTPIPCATAKTNSEGTVIFDRLTLRQCINKQRTGGLEEQNAWAEAPKLLVIAREGQDWAFVRTLEYSGAYSYGVDTGWQSDKPESRGTIFSDRALYQPAEEVWLTGLAHYLQNGELKQDQKVSYKVTLVAPDGKQTNLGSQVTNEFGTFSLMIPLAKNQPLGIYTIRAKSEKGVEISGTFRVAEFKPPNFKVDLALNVQGKGETGKQESKDTLIAVIDQKVSATAQSDYLFGAPVQGGSAKYTVTRTTTEFQPQGWEQFSFGQKWFWPEEQPSLSSEVLQESKALDAKGAGNTEVTVAKDLLYPMTYRVDVEVADVSNLSVANSQSFVALPSDRLIGLKSNFVAEAGQPFSIQAIVTDPTGKARPNELVRVELQQMKYNSVSQVVEGSVTSRNQVEYTTIAQTEVRSQNDPQTIALTPPDSGSYRIRANFANAKSDVTAADLQIWATGGNAVNWGSRYRNNRLELSLDQPSYKVGETATALIQSPYAEAELHLAVVRHDVIYRTVTKVKGGAPQVQFQITPEMLPNAAVEAVLVRQGQSLSQVEAGKLDGLMRIGFTPFKTNLEDKYLKVTAKANSESLEPAQKQTIQLELQDSQGKPTKGQFTIMVVNEAVLQLSGHRPPDLVVTVYAEQPISTRFGDNRPDVVLEPLSSPLEKGWGYGGGLSAGAASTRLRENFEPIAYYNGSVITDAQGKASVTFKLPDNLTTWRVMVVATDGKFHFGNGETTFITTKPLLSNPLMPQFARQGDRFEIGVAVTNTTGQTGEVDINGLLTGSLKFGTDPLSTSLTTTQNSKFKIQNSTQAYRFPVVAESIGESQLQFTTNLNGAGDAFKIPLEVKPLEITEQVVETGTIAKSIKIPLNVDATVEPNVGGLEISLASTLIPQLVAPVQQVFEQDTFPFLETTASQLVIAASLNSLSRTYAQTFNNFNAQQQATRALEQLQRLQKPDGGFATWAKQERSDPFVTPYAAKAIAIARQAFSANTVDAGMVSRLRTYLQKLLANPNQNSVCSTQLCEQQIRLETLLALDALGEKRNDFLADIYGSRNQLERVAQIKLARYLFQFPEWRDEAGSMQGQIQETISETGRAATVNNTENFPQGWSWLNSPTALQAQALRLFIAQPSQPETDLSSLVETFVPILSADKPVKPEIRDRLLQGLLALRREGTWQTTYDNAAAFTALVAYSQTQPTPPNFTATAQLAGKTISAQFVGYRRPNLEIKMPMAELPRGRQDLLLEKSGQGNLHYLVAYRYSPQGIQSGRLNGLRVIRTIYPAASGGNQANMALHRYGLQPNNEPLQVDPGQVFDIGLEIITDHPVNHVIINDPLPAGFEAVDTSFQTANSSVKAQVDSWQIDYQQIYRDRITAYANYLAPGVYNLHYLVRSVTPGTFLYPSAEAHLQYAPEEFGRSASSRLVVRGIR